MIFDVFDTPFLISYPYFYVQEVDSVFSKLRFNPLSCLNFVTLDKNYCSVTLPTFYLNPMFKPDWTTMGTFPEDTTINSSDSKISPFMSWLRLQTKSHNTR